MKFKDKYKMTADERVLDLKQKSHLEIKDKTDINKCLAFCLDLMLNKTYHHVRLYAFGNQFDRCIMIAELLKRKLKNLHQVVTFETHEFTKTYTPIVEEPGFVKFKKIKLKTVINILLSKTTPSNTKQAGYQKPIDAELVSKSDPRLFIDSVLKQSKQPKKKMLMSEARKQNQNDSYEEEHRPNEGRPLSKPKTAGYEKPRNSSKGDSKYYAKKHDGRDKRPDERNKDRDRDDDYYEKKHSSSNNKREERKVKSGKEEETKTNPRVKWEVEDDDREKHDQPKRKKFPKEKIKKHNEDRYQTESESEEDLDKTLYPVQVNSYKGRTGRDNRKRIEKIKQKDEEALNKMDKILDELESEGQFKPANTEQDGDAKGESKVDSKKKPEHKEHREHEKRGSSKTKPKKQKAKKNEFEYVKKDDEGKEAPKKEEIREDKTKEDPKEDSNIPKVKYYNERKKKFRQANEVEYVRKD